MSDVFDIFKDNIVENAESAYERLGYPRNPFRASGDEQVNSFGPFYAGHIQTQVDGIKLWIQDVHSGRSRTALSIVGNIGAGKTRILQYLRRSLLSSPPKEKIACELVLLSETGYSRASVGGMLVAALERMALPSSETLPDGVLPIVWGIVTSSIALSDVHGTLAGALQRTQNEHGEKRKEYARLISRWLQRSPLTASEANTVGLHRKLDWEGELIGIVAELIRIAAAVGVLRTFFLFVDQLEDLFRPTFSELRRSRILTDLRGLVDEIDKGTPIGLILSWSPDVSAAANRQARNEVELRFQSSYDALYSRMQRRRVVLPLLSLENATPFTLEWIEAAKNEVGFDEAKQPKPYELATKAWADLERGRKLYPGGKGVATPRDLLTALADEVDRRAGIS